VNAEKSRTDDPSRVTEQMLSSFDNERNEDDNLPARELFVGTSSAAPASGAILPFPPMSVIGRPALLSSKGIARSGSLDRVPTFWSPVLPPLYFGFGAPRRGTHRGTLKRWCLTSSTCFLRGRRPRSPAGDSFLQLKGA